MNSMNFTLVGGRTFGEMLVLNVIKQLCTITFYITVRFSLIVYTTYRTWWIFCVALSLIGFIEPWRAPRMFTFSECDRVISKSLTRYLNKTFLSFSVFSILEVILNIVDNHLLRQVFIRWVAPSFTVDFKLFKIHFTFSGTFLLYIF